MKPIRRGVTLAATVAVALSLAAGPAAAKAPKGSFDYYATIDCGSGPVEVGSGVDLYSTLVDVDSGKKYKPVAWHVSGDGFALDDARKGESKKQAVVCSYTDGVATGTVTVKKA
jgi:hypothetical protein